MDLLDALRTRRSAALSGLTEPGPGASEIQSLLTFASRVPDHGRLAPWRFIVIEGEARARLGRFVAGVWRGKDAGMDSAAVAAGVAQWEGRFGAPLIVAVVMSPKANPKIPEVEQVLSCGAACMNLLLGAKGMGFGAVWLTEWYAYDGAVMKELGLAGGERLAGFVHVGAEREARADRERPRLEGVVTRY
ncbi:MAG: nitroreductase [Phycisphaerales bacterium]|nr:nitroreductase [Phycisphaerales bacterium]